MLYRKSLRIEIATALFIGVGLLCSACARKELAVAPAAEISGARTFAAIEEPRPKDNTLAYEHTVEIEMPVDVLANRIESVRKACAADTANGCTLLEIVNGKSSDVPLGHVKMRVGAGGVGGLIELAKEGGRLLETRTHAEDLAQPIGDTARQLALFNLHRQRLMEFMNRKDIGVEQLITVSKELATVQSQLEQFESEQANLKRRVDTELLTISWRAPVSAYQSSQSPVFDALRSFGANFRDAVAQVLIFLAYVLPWMVIAVPALMALRWFWRWLGGWLNARRNVAQ